MNLDQRLLRQAQKARLALAVTVGLGFGSGVLTVLQASLLSQVIDRVFLGGRGLADVYNLVAILVGVILLRAGLTWGSEVTANATAVHVKTSLRRLLFQHLLRLGPAYARGEKTGELAITASEGIEALDAYFSQYLPQLVLAALVPLTFLAFVLPLDPLSGLVLLLTAPLIPVFMILIGNLAQALTRRQWQTLSRMSAYFLDVLQGLTALRILGRSRAQVQVIEQVSERFRQVTMGVLRVTFLSALALEMVATLSTAIVAVQIGLRLLYGQLTFAEAFFVLLLAPEFYLPLRMLGTRFHAGMSGAAAARRIFEILETPFSQATSCLPPASADATGPGELPAIVFEDVHYTYAGDRPALRGVSFEIASGQKIALVGPSGAGKSTLASLLLRFLEPSQGRIRVGGQPLSEISTETWRTRLAWVSQPPYLFHGTIADNIRLARPQASLEEVVQAARQAHAHEFIHELPQRYDTPVGERGARLSGGQAQRIALARAFLKDAPLVILDEATANLDPETESQIAAALQRLLAGRTALIIAHRLSTIYLADQVLVFDQGSLVESGTHSALLQQNGLYSRLVHAYAPREMLPFERSTFNTLPPLPFIHPPSSSHLPASSFLPAPAPFLRLLGLIAPFKGLIARSVLLGFATIGSSIGLMITSAYIISAAALQPSIALLQVPIVGVRFFGISRGLFRYLERLVSHQVTFRLLARLRVWFYQRLETLAPARLIRYRSGDLLARILGDIETLENFYVRVLAPPLVAILVSLAMSLFMALYDPSLALALLAFLLATGAGVPLLAYWLSRDTGRSLVSRQAALKVSLVDGIQGMAELLVFGQAQRQAGRVESLGRDLALSQRRMAHLSGLQSAISSLLANLCLLVILVLAIPLVRSDRIEGVYLAVLVLAALTSFEAVLPLPLAAQYLESNLEAARRLFEIVDAQPEVVDPPDPIPLPGAAQVISTFSLEVRNLCFQYPPSLSRNLSPLYALDRISFSLPAGKRLAVVGPSGSGKSTLVNLLLRFWEYETGEILLNGQSLRQYNQDDIRRSLGVVTQNTYLFNATLRENLLIARPKASEAELERAVKLAQVHTFIHSLPQGYETWVGEQGLRLSSGERQRIAIARALLKDPQLLVLDEATANLDSLTERAVLKSISMLMEGRTTLMITHRLVGLEAMDEILVLQAGRVVERGRHEELLAQGGLYFQMWELQNQVLAV